MKNDLAVEIAEKLQAALANLYTDFEVYQRLNSSNPQVTIGWYRNILNLIVGAMCSKLGYAETLSIMRDLLRIEKHQYENEKDRRVKIAEGWQ